MINLPKDLQWNILEFLDFQDLWAYARMNKVTWEQFANIPLIGHVPCSLQNFQYIKMHQDGKAKYPHDLNWSLKHNWIPMIKMWSLHYVPHNLENILVMAAQHAQYAQLTRSILTWHHTKENLLALVQYAPKILKYGHLSHFRWWLNEYIHFSPLLKYFSSLILRFLRTFSEQGLKIIYFWVYQLPNPSLQTSELPRHYYLTLFVKALNICLRTFMRIENFNEPRPEFQPIIKFLLEDELLSANLEHELLLYFLQKNQVILVQEFLEYGNFNDEQWDFYCRQIRSIPMCFLFLGFAAESIYMAWPFFWVNQPLIGKYLLERLTWLLLIQHLDNCCLNTLKEAYVHLHPFVGDPIYMYFMNQVQEKNSEFYEYICEYHTQHYHRSKRCKLK